MSTQLIDLAKNLISCPSLTPDDAGCQSIIADYLAPLGFTIEPMRFGKVDNLWAKIGKQRPLFVFAGHTDVVPTGPLDEWISPPFTPDIRDECLYGRGASDMKGAIAAMLTATSQFIKTHPSFIGSIAFLITSDEEGPSVDGTKKVIDALIKRGEIIDYCLIGEPSSAEQVGDQIRIGRRGSLHGKLSVHGKQGHVAHPHLAKNPIHDSALALHELSHSVWDEGNEYFPPTTFQISNLHSGTGAANVIPGHLDSLFNFRFSTAVTIDELRKRTEALLKKHGLQFDMSWEVGAEPFLTKHGHLLSATQQAIKAQTGLDTQLSTGGGTSDGRFIIKTQAELVELGVSHQTAHHTNECVSIKALETLTAIYERILTLMLTGI